MHRYKRHFQDSIAQALSLVPGAIVTCNVELDTTISRSNEQLRHDPKAVPIRISETSATLKSESAPRSGPPGLNAQQPQANAAASIAQVAKGSSTDEERSTREEVNMVSQETIKTQEAGHTPKKVTVSIVVPKSYFEKVWHQQHPTPPGETPKKPDEKALAQIESLETLNIRKIAAGLLPNPDNKMLDLTPLVTVTTAPTTPEVEIPSPSTADEALTWFGENWSTLGMCLAAAAENPGPQSAGALKPAAAESSRSRLKRKTTSGTLKEDLVEMVREDPDAAANILRGWIGSAS
jgi:flagellar M-ring protein FliF